MGRSVQRGPDGRNHVSHTRQSASHTLKPLRAVVTRSRWPSYVAFAKTFESIESNERNLDHKIRLFCHPGAASTTTSLFVKLMSGNK